MAPIDRELGELTTEVATLKRDMKEVKGTVESIQTDMKEVLEYISEEKGARAERAKYEKRRDKLADDARDERHFQIEITWTKIMAFGAVVGAITGAMALAPHFILHAQ